MTQKLIISLDCWGTIIEARQSLWDAYSTIVKDVSGSTLSVPDISAHSKRLNQEFDRPKVGKRIRYTQAERLGVLVSIINSSVEENKINNTVATIISKLDRLLNDADRYFYVINKDLIDVIKENADNFCNIILSSNTGYISGKQMVSVMCDLGIDIFDQCFFSDEMGCLKPSQKFIDRIIHTYGADGNSIQLFHIGDNYYYDNFSVNDPTIKSVIISDSNLDQVTQMVRDLK